MTAGHAAADEVLRSPDSASAGSATGLPTLPRVLLGRARDERAPGPTEPPSTLAVEPPDHTRPRPTGST